MTLPSAPVVDPTSLATRHRLAVDRAGRLCAHGHRVVARARGLTSAGFTVEGVVAARPAVLRWVAGRTEGDAEALVRLGLVLDLALPDAAGPVPALDGDRAAALVAVLRSFDRVTSVVLHAPATRPRRGS